MMQLTLIDAEAALLADLLGQERGDTRTLIHHSRTAEAKLALRRRLQLVEGLLGRLQAAAAR